MFMALFVFYSSIWAFFGFCGGSGRGFALLSRCQCRHQCLCEGPAVAEGLAALGIHAAGAQKHTGLGGFRGT